MGVEPNQLENRTPPQPRFAPFESKSQVLVRQEGIEPSTKPYQGSVMPFNYKRKLTSK